MIEVWKDITEYEGLYQVSNLGRVKSLSVRKPSAIQKCGYRIKNETIICTSPAFKYLKVCLCVNGIRRYYFLHRLVCVTFLENPDNLEQVNHKDGNKHNNNLSNLEWCSRSDNAKHSFKLGLSYQPRSKKINVYTFPDKVFVKTFDNILAAANFTKANRSNIYHVLKGSCKQAKGFYFELFSEWQSARIA